MPGVDELYILARGVLLDALEALSEHRGAARLVGHDARSVRIVRGLEGVLVDRDRMAIGSLQAEDSRSLEIQVAGSAALLIAKMHKIQDRQGTSRHGDKDALGVLRLLRGTSTEEMAGRFRRVLLDPDSRAAAETAAKWLFQQFGSPRGDGVAMTRQAIGPLGDPEEISASCVALVSDLRRAIGD
jgi:hypothetical protein